MIHCVNACITHWDNDHHKTSQEHSIPPLYSVMCNQDLYQRPVIKLKVFKQVQAKFW